MFFAVNWSISCVARPMLIAAGDQPVGQVFQGQRRRFRPLRSSLLQLQPGKNLWSAIIANGLPGGSQVGPRYFAAVDIVRQPDVLYLATNYAIHASWDAGSNWLPRSQGVPTRCHPCNCASSWSPTVAVFAGRAWRAALN
jgi:hypothetical protein